MIINLHGPTLSLWIRLPSIVLAGIVGAPRANAQSTAVPPTAAAWVASDSIRFETYLGRPSIYINRGVALARGVALRDGTIEFDWAATPRTNFLGIAFHATAVNNSETIFFRVGQTGTKESVQYGPALNTYGAAWQVYHGAGANAVATLQRERWTHLRVTLAGDVATMFLDGAEKPTLVIPHLAGVAGTSAGVWAGNFGRGAYFSNFTATPSPNVAAALPPKPLPPGTITDWMLSQALDAPTITPGRLPPKLAHLGEDRRRADGTRADQPLSRHAHRRRSGRLGHG